MAKMFRNSATVCEPRQFSAVESERIRHQLESLLASPQFRTGRRCQLLLQYVTDRALAGDLDGFKERTLGVSAFGRAPNYNTNQDPVVRATAAEIRKKLAQYYQEPEHEEEIRIVLLAGSYVPEFQFPEVARAPVALVEEPKRAQRKSLFMTFGVVVGVAAAILAVNRLSRSPIDQFWGRIAGSPSVLICVGEPPAYIFRSDKMQSDLSALMEHPSAESLAVSHQLIPLSELVPMPNRYMAMGDALCLLHLGTFFDKRGILYYLRNSGATTFSDLREHAAVLIGAFNNEWTLRLGSQLRFSFVKNFHDPAGITEMVSDRDHPEQANWKLTNAWPDWNVPTDYAIISRVLGRETDRLLVVAAGITQYGTDAAGEFITNPKYFSEVLSQLPGDWPTKNLQIVLKVPVVHGASGHPRVIATYVW